MGQQMQMRAGQGLPGLLKDGYKHMSGLEEAIGKNIEACQQLSTITSTSLGPNGAPSPRSARNAPAAAGAAPSRGPGAAAPRVASRVRLARRPGMNKLVINHLEKIFVTSDTGTIVKELEVVHPAAKMVVMAATMQESEVRLASHRTTSPAPAHGGLTPLRRPSSATRPTSSSPSPASS